MSTLPACCTSTRRRSYSFGDSLTSLVADLDDAAHEVDGQIAEAEHRPLAVGLQLMAQAPPASGQAARPCRTAWSRNRRRRDRAPGPCRLRRRGWRGRRSGTPSLRARIVRSRSCPSVSGRPRSRMIRSGASFSRSSAALPFARLQRSGSPARSGPCAAACGSAARRRPPVRGAELRSCGGVQAAGLGAGSAG